MMVSVAGGQFIRRSQRQDNQVLQWILPFSRFTLQGHLQFWVQLTS